MTAGRERLGVLVLGGVGAAVALLTAGRTWLTVMVSDPLVGSGRIHADGRSVAGVVPAAALVGLAAVVAAVTLRRLGRFVAGVLLVVAGGAVGAAAVSVLLHPRSAAAGAVGAATGQAGSSRGVASAGVAPWPWVAVFAAVLLVLAGAVTVVRGRRWSGLSGRYDAPVAGEPAGDQPAGSADDVAADAWDAVSRGEDPTG
jgi:uncharacterized membrane protein (TIGR02234 family)